MLNRYITLESKKESNIKAIEQYTQNNASFVAKILTDLEDKFKTLQSNIKKVQKTDLKDISSSEGVNYKTFSALLISLNKNKSTLDKDEDDKLTIDFKTFLEYAVTLLKDKPSLPTAFALDLNSDKDTIEKTLESIGSYWSTNAKENQGQASKSYERFIFLNGDYSAIGIDKNGSITLNSSVDDKYLIDKKVKCSVSYNSKDVKAVNLLSDLEIMDMKYSKELDTLGEQINKLDKDNDLLPMSEKQSKELNEYFFALNKYISNRVILENSIVNELVKITNKVLESK